MKTPSFKVRKIKIGGVDYFAVYVPAAFSGTGKTVRRVFRSRTAAEILRGQLVSAWRERTDTAVLTVQQNADALAALAVLRSAGLPDVSLVQACTVAVPAFLRLAEGAALGEVLGLYEQAKSPAWSAVSRRNFANTRKLLLEQFGHERRLASITAEELETWLAERFERPAYRANVVRNVRPVFSFAVKKEKIASNPFDKMEAIRVQRKSEIDIYTAEEAGRLLACAPEECRAAFLLLLFAGIRPAELARLKWRDVKNGFIHVSPEIAKTAQVRNVDMLPGLREALDHLRKEDGQKVCPAAWLFKAREVKRAAGLLGRPDAARHSFASYLLASGESVEKVKAMLGHSRGSDTLFAHYRAAATAEEAVRYFGLIH